MKEWIIGRPDVDAAHKLSVVLGISQLSAEVLVSRGICLPVQAEKFFGGGETDSRGLYSPFDLPDMEKAVQILNVSLDRGEKICIYGDYDCDGILSSAALYNYLIGIGGNVSYFINERSDGYGMNIDNVRRLAEEGNELIITVDNGISAVAEAELCSSLGVKLLITDHHTPPPELPRAAAVVDPHINSPENKAVFRDICGCGVVLKLITAMEDGDSTIPIEMMSDFAAIATIGDVMPLVGENRVIVKHGLHYIGNTENLGLKALISAVSAQSKKPLTIDSRTAAFTLVPRINASGRMGSAMDAAELFTTDDPERADELAKKLCELNNARRAAEEKISKDADIFLESHPSHLNAPVITAVGKGWHPGVIGITAARLCEQTGKPVFMISEKEDGSCVGSARAPEGFSVYEALFGTRDLLTKFGGHQGAGGFSLPSENTEEFCRRLSAFASEDIFLPRLKAVKQLLPAEMIVQNAEKLRDELSPFGEGNPEPIFLLGSVRIAGVRPLSEGKYTRVNADFGGTALSFPIFTARYEDFPFSAGDTVNIMAHIGVNEYNGSITPAISVCDMRINGVNQMKLINGEKAFALMQRGKYPQSSKVTEAMLPSRENFAAVYRAIPADRDIPENIIFNRFCVTLNSCVIQVILDVFAQTGLIRRYAAAGTVRRADTDKSKKTDLDASDTIKNIKAAILAAKEKEGSGSDK